MSETMTPIERWALSVDEIAESSGCRERTPIAWCVPANSHRSASAAVSSFPSSAFEPNSSTERTSPNLFVLWHRTTLSENGDRLPSFGGHANPSREHPNLRELWEV